MKLKMLWNTISTRIWILILTLLGVLQALAFITTGHVGAITAASRGYIHEVGAISVLIGAAITLGWTLGPVITSGVDNTLDPRALATYVPPSRRLSLALIGATGAGIAGIFTLLITLPLTASYLISGVWSSAILSVVLMPIACLTCWTWSRTLSTFLSVILDARSRLKDTLTVIGVLIFLAAFAPLGAWIQLAANNFSWEWIFNVSRVVAWTPLGAPFGALFSLESGSVINAAGQTLLSLATLAIGFVVWNRILPYAMSGVHNPVKNPAWDAMKQGHYLIDDTLDHVPATRISRTGNPKEKRFLAGVDLWERLGLSAPSASLAARTVHEWIYDPRLSTSLSTALFFPFMAVVMTKTLSEEGATTPLSIFFLLMTSIVLGAGAGALSSFDSTAFWILVASGITGRRERLARMFASALIHIPLIVVASSAATFFLDYSFPDATALVAFLVCIYVMASALCSLLSAFVVYPVQPPGTSPLSSKGTGSFTVTALVQVGGQFGSLILGIPAVIAYGLSATGYAPTWVTLLVSVLWTVAVFIATPFIAGRIWDARSVDVLRQIRSWPGH